MKAKLLILILVLISGYLIFYSCDDNSFPVPPASTVPKFTYTIDNNEYAPANVLFTNISIVPEEAGSPTYTWNFGDGSSSSEVNPTHLYEEPGAFTVRLTVMTSVSLEIKEKTETVVIKDPNASGTQVYFTNGSVVYSGIVNDQAPIFSVLNGPSTQDSYSMVLDTVHDYLYISDYETDKIYRLNLDGSNFTEFRSGAIGATGMAIDYENNYIYWSTNDGIQRANLSSDNVNQIEDFLTGLNDPDGLAIDYVNNKLYWINYSGGIGAINLDGTGQVEISATVEGGSIIVVGNRIYYDEWIASGDIRIKSANLDGSNESTIATGLARVVYALAYEPDQQKLYWGDRSTYIIYRSNLDGSGTETWYNKDGVQPRGLVFGKKF